MTQSFGVMKPFLILLLALGLWAGSSTLLPAADEALVKQYKDYWFQAAEVSSYELTQQQYGQPRPGTAVLIYVTEPFLEKKGVKNDGLKITDNEEHSATALKLNRMEKFLTGVYPYSLMTSVFTPYEPGYDVQPYKVTFSAQDWCGQSFYQLNQREGGLKVQWRSYFQEPGDGEVAMTDFPVEDNMWNLIRLDPTDLPQGRCLMVPSFEFNRLGHVPPGPQEVEGKTETKGETSTYTMTYPKLGRVLAITYQTKFPHRILGWRERRSANAKWTEAKLKTTKIMPYWEQNKPADTKLRKELQLP